MERIDIVEPTLSSEAGHCHSFIESICSAQREGEEDITVYAGSKACLPRIQAMGVRVIPYFHRRIRRPEAFLLYRRLLREPGRLFVSTAGRADMTLLSLAAGGVIPPRKAFLYFHWVNLTPEKREFFRKAALRQPHLVLLGPTPTVTGIFRECGFADVVTVPYPATPAAGTREGGPFRHLLYAGAARQDKGFGRIVDLVAHLSSLRLTLPVAIQTSPDHYDRYDARTRSDLKRLEKLRYPFLRVFPGTLDPESYAELFRGGICLQPYRREEFTDRVSGVMLDAMSAGCPVIATEGTWMARAVRRFDAGLLVEDLSPEALLAAARAVIGEYGRYRENASAAGRTLQEENSARHLYEFLAAS